MKIIEGIDSALIYISKYLKDDKSKLESNGNGLFEENYPPELFARNIIKTMREFVHFGASGGLIFCTNLAVTALCHEFIGVPVNLAYICGFITTMFVSFLLCRHVIFDAASGDVKYQFLISQKVNLD